MMADRKAELVAVPDENEVFTNVEGPMLPLPLAVNCAGRSVWPAGHIRENPYGRSLAVELCTGGEGRLIAAERDYRIVPGDLFLHHRGVPNRYGATDETPFEKSFFGFLPGCSEAILAELGLTQVHVVKLPQPDVERAIQCIDAIIELLDAQAFGCEQRASLLAYELLLMAGAAAQHLDVRGDKTPEPLLAAMSHARSYLHQPLQVADLARIADCTPDHLNRLFRQHYGLRAHEWLERLRIQHAIHLLDVSLMRVQDIAGAVGYPDAALFSTVFRRVTGISPSAYRQRRFPVASLDQPRKA